MAALTTLVTLALGACAQAQPQGAAPGAGPAAVADHHAPMSFTVHALCGEDARRIDPAAEAPPLPAAAASPLGPACSTALLARGRIDKDAAVRLRERVQAHNRERGLPLDAPSLALIHLDSPGGDLRGGLALGREIRRLGLAARTGGDFNVTTGSRETARRQTLAPATHCYSSCAYAFLGGSTRYVSVDRAYGVHQFRPAEQEVETPGKSATARAQAVVSLLNLYLDEMGVQRALLDIANLTAPDKMTLLGRAQALKLLVDTGTQTGLTQPQQTPWTLGATEKGLPFAQSRVKLDARRIVGLTLTVDPQGNPVLAVSAEFAQRPIDPPRTGSFPLETAPRVALSIPEDPAGSLPAVGQSPRWIKRERAGTSVLFGTGFQLRRDALSVLESQALAKRSLVVSDGLPPELADWRFNARFRLDGLERTLRLLQHEADDPRGAAAAASATPGADPNDPPHWR